MFHCFFDPFIYWWALTLFPALGYCKLCCYDIGVHRFFWISVSGFLGYNPSSVIARWKSSSVFSFWGNPILFSTVATPVCIPTSSVLGFPFIYNPSNTCLLSSLWYPLWPCEEVSHCGFNLHLCDGYRCWASFHISLGPLYVLLGELSIQALCPFFNWVVCFFWFWLL